MVVRVRATTMMTSIKPRGSIGIWVVVVVSHGGGVWRSGGGAEAVMRVVHEAVDVGEAAVDHGRLEVGAFGVLTLSLVCILMAS